MKFTKYTIDHNNNTLTTPTGITQSIYDASICAQYPSVCYKATDDLQWFLTVHPTRFYTASKALNGRQGITEVIVPSNTLIKFPLLNHKKTDFNGSSPKHADCGVIGDRYIQGLVKEARSYWYGRYMELGFNDSLYGSMEAARGH